MPNVILPMTLLLLVGASADWSDRQGAARKLDGFVVTVGPEEGNNGMWFRVDGVDGRVSEFLVPHVFDSARVARDLTHYRADRLVIRFGKGGVVVVDPRSGTIVDRFLALREVQSPGGRYLAIQRWTPNGVEYVDSVYSVYDFERTSERNRPGTPNVGNAGWIVYPPENVEAASYAVTRHANDAHDLLSPLSWINEHVLAFVDHNRGNVKLVMVDVAAGIDRARTSETLLNLRELLRPSSPGNAPNLLRVRTVEMLDTSETSVAMRVVFEPSSLLRKSAIVVHATRPHKQVR